MDTKKGCIIAEGADSTCLRKYTVNLFHLQSFTKYLRLTLAFM